MANETPESEFSIECFQNYSAGEVFVQGLAGVVDQNDVESLIRSQKTMLQRFEKTTEMLTNCNALSAARLKLAGQEFRKHTQVLTDMKKDLDYIFKKIRIIKTKLSQQYPEAYKIAVAASFANRRPSEDDEEGQSSSNIDSRATLTVSTETLRPAGENTMKVEAQNKMTDGNKMAEENKMDDTVDSSKVDEKNSSSSETEGQDSSRDSSTDTG